MAATLQVASVADPLRMAVPAPPRSLVHFTRYSRMLSDAAPASPTTSVELPAIAPAMLTLGAILSILLHFRRSACSSADISGSARSLLAPPHADNAKHATACETASAVRFI